MNVFQLLRKKNRHLEGIQIEIIKTTLPQTFRGFQFIDQQSDKQNKTTTKKTRLRSKQIWENLVELNKEITAQINVGKCR